jgi:hypothetical protein
MAYNIVYTHTIQRIILYVNIVKNKFFIKTEENLLSKIFSYKNSFDKAKQAGKSEQFSGLAFLLY